jgi:hypothetical protein
MNTALDDAKRLRVREAALADAASRVGRDFSPGVPSLVAQTKAISSYPTVAQRFYACSPLTVLGPEVEGGPGTMAAGTSTFHALNLGSAVPPLGANVVVTFVDNRWVFRYDG